MCKHVIVNGVVREKSTFKHMNITRKMMFEILSQGYIKIDTGGVSLTRKGRDAILTGVYPVKTSKDFYHQRKNRGYHPKTVWVHDDDLDKFEQFVRTELTL